MPKKQPVKWQLTVYPAGKRMHERGQDGNMHSTAVWSREYLAASEKAGRSSALRAVPYLRRQFPGDRIELTRFVFTGWFWVARDPAERLEEVSEYAEVRAAGHPARAAAGGYPPDTCRIIYPHGDTLRVCSRAMSHAGGHSPRDRERFPEDPPLERSSHA
jgi:hypothetical protein